MRNQQFTDQDGAFVRRYDYDDEWTVAADLDASDDDVDVDVVGTTAIVVVDRGDGVSEAEFELPSAAARFDIQNGVLTVRGNR